MPLAVPIPEVIAETVDVLEKPLKIRCGPVTMPDGETFSIAHLGDGEEHSGTAGVLAYRQGAAAAAVEVWDEGAGPGWIPGAGTTPSDLTPLPLFFSEDDPAAPWQSLIVAAASTDGNGDPQFHSRSPGAAFPRYFFRAYFAHHSNGVAETGLSPPSRDVRFVSLTDALRAGMRVGEDEKPESAKEVHLFLRDSSLRTLGEMALYNDGGTARIEIVKQDGAASPVSRILIDPDGTIEMLGPETGANQRTAVRLKASGDLHVEAAPGQRTVINGTLEISASGSDVTLACAGTLTLKANEVAIETDGGNLETLFASAIQTGRIRYQPATAAGASDGGPQWLRRTI